MQEGHYFAINKNRVILSLWQNEQVRISDGKSPAQKRRRSALRRSGRCLSLRATSGRQMVAKQTYKVRSKVWLYPGMAGWHFVNVDKKQSAALKEKYGKRRRGFGSI